MTEAAPAKPATTRGPKAAPTTAPVVAPAATVRTMIVCLPDELPPEPLTVHQLDRHFHVCGTLQARFWASPTIHRWQRSQLFALRKGRPAYSAGGPVRLLDLDGMRQAAAVGAGIRHQMWHQVVHGTAPAHPWTAFYTRHLADAAKYPRERAEADFWNQPRVNAMRMHNAATYGTRLPAEELEMFQAGSLAYQHYSACTAICGDALLCVDGHRLVPAGDTLAHRVTYLEQAIRHLDAIDPDQRILAVAL